MTDPVSTHTAGPWEIIFDGNRKIVARAGCPEGKYRTICDMSQSVPLSMEREANATFIVRACNNFDGLLAALQMWLAYDDLDDLYFAHTQSMFTYGDAIAATRAAIAAATEAP